MTDEPVVLVSLSSKRLPPEPPLGVAYLAGVLRQAGYRPVIYDYALWPGPVESLAEEVAQQHPLLVGLSALTPAIPTAVDLARRLRGKSRAPVILGGPHATFEYETLLRQAPEIDYVGLFEGEHLLPLLLETLLEGKEGGDVPGVASRADGEIRVTPPLPRIADLDEVPLPARDLLNMEAYTADMGRGTLLASRGCPYHCTFCSSSRFHGHAVRSHSVERIVEELCLLTGEYGATRCWFLDDLFTADEARTVALCEEIVRRGVRVAWGCETRFDTVSPELLRLMSRAGCFYIFYGMESTGQEVLNRVGKQTQSASFRQVMRMTQEAGITVKISLMIGLPGDTQESIRRSIDFVQQAGPDYLAVLLATPLPGSPLWDHPERFGVTIVDRDLEHYDYLHPVIETPFLTQRMIRDAYLEAVASSVALTPLQRKVSSNEGLPG